MMLDKHQKDFIKLYREVSYRHNGVIADFAETVAIAIQNAVSLHDDQWKAREERYLQVAKQYTPGELDGLRKMLGCLTLSLEERMHDAMGEIYMSDEVAGRSKWDNDVCLTPWEVGVTMATMTLADFKMPDRGWFALSEPACGTGCLVIAAAHVLKNQGVDFQRTMHVTAIDVRAPLAHLAYIQLSLLGVPAIVQHGNTLSLETWSTWRTPFHFLGLWEGKIIRWRKEQSPQQSPQPSSVPVPKGQLALWT